MSDDPEDHEFDPEDDGFFDADPEDIADELVDFEDEEADLASSSKRLFTTDRARKRVGTPKVKRGASRSLHRERRRRNRLIARAAGRYYGGVIQKPIAGHLRPLFSEMLMGIAMRFLSSDFIHCAQKIAAAKVEGVSSAGDFIEIPVNAVLSCALARLAKRMAPMTAADADKIAARLSDMLNLTGKVIKVAVTELQESDDLDEVDSEAFDALIADEWAEHEDMMRRPRPARPTGGQPRSSGARIAAKALRRAARHLLKVERHLTKGRS